MKLLEKLKLKRKLASAILLKSLTYAFALFGLFFILLLAVLAGMLGTSGSVVSVPDNAILTLDLDNDFSEVRQDTLIADVIGKPIISFADMLMSIEMAAHDERIKAIAAKINTPSMGFAQMQELHQAIRDFRAQGKKAYLYSSGMGDGGGGTSAYYLATAFDEITMLPNSDIGLTGVSIEVPFARELLDKLGIYPEFYARYEHKNAMASLTDKTAPKVISDDLRQLAKQINNQLVEGIIAARGLKISQAELSKRMDNAPFAAEQALQWNLIDKIAYETDWQAELQKTTKGEKIDLSSYSASWSLQNKKQNIALLVLEGAISGGKSMINPMNGELTIGSDTVLAQIKDIAEDETIKAVVVRVNSPGGSYTASNEIRHALVRLKETKNIPLIISMGDYAASGGYFISLAGDKILAEAATITGSIGVLGGKPVLQKLWQKLGVNWLFVETSESSGFLSANRPFSAQQKKIFNRSLDRVYQDFTTKVSQFRDIDLKKLDKLARGRIWLGSAAKENGLIDEIGGLGDAVVAAKKAAQLKSEDISIVFYPKPKTLQEKIAELTANSQVSAAQVLKTEIGLDISAINMLKRLQYDAVLVPFGLK